MSIKMSRTRVAFLAMLGIACMPMSVFACQDYWTAAYKCAQGCGCGGSPPDDGGERRARRDAEKAELRATNALIDRYNEKIDAANAVANAGRYREAARLKRQAVA